MAEKRRIGILGLGAVGGYFGGHLAETYCHSGKAEIIFIARPATEKIIREKGLKLITPEYEKIIFPDLVSSDPDKIGPLDYLICSVKSYDLEDSLKPLGACISGKTIILPLLNGVDAKERISKMYPGSETIGGCVYIVARRVEPGVIRETGAIHTLYFGSETAEPEKLLELKQLFSDAHIECFLTDRIEKTIWEKFVFISSLASLTTYLNLTIGPVLSNPVHRRTLIELMLELKAIAEAKNIFLPDNIIEATLAKMEKLPPETTSSMHSDSQKGGRTEYRSLTAYVANCGRELHVPTPVFEKIEQAFISREKTARV